MRSPHATGSRIVESLWPVLLGFFTAFLILAGTSDSAEPKTSPHRFIPAKGLVAYLEYEGLDAHAAAWNASAAHGILVDAHAGAMMWELVRQVLDRVLKEDPKSKLTGADIMALHDQLMHHGFAVAFHDQGKGKLAMTVVLGGIGDKAVRGRFTRLATSLLVGDGEKPAASIRVRGRDVFVDWTEPSQPPHLPANHPASWWFEGDDLVLVAAHLFDTDPPVDTTDKQKPSPDYTGYRSLVFDTIDGKEPNLTTNAAYAAAIAEGKEIKGFEQNGLLLLDPSECDSLLSVLFTSPARVDPLSLPAGKYISTLDLPPQLAIPDSVNAPPAELPDNVFAAAVDPALVLAGNVPTAKKKKNEPDPLKVLGLDGIKRIVVRWGFQGKALLTDVRIEAPAPRKGVVAWLDQPSFRRDRLPPIPRGTGAFVIGSFDFVESYSRIIRLMKEVEPDLANEVAQMERVVLQEIGLGGLDDLRVAGPGWFALRLPSAEGQPHEGVNPDPTAYALVAGIDDPNKFGKVLDTIAARAGNYLAELYKNDGPDQPGNNGANAPVLAVEKLKAPDRGYQLTSPARLVPWLNDDLKPTILVGASHVAIAANLDRAREALSAELPGGAVWSPQGELTKALECLPENLTFLAVADSRGSSWPALLEQLPGNLQMLAGYLGGLDGDDVSTASELLTIVGIPAPGGFRFRIDPAQIPKADQVRTHLFASVLAATVDQRGFRLIDREAFPLGCAWSEAEVKWTSTLGSKGLDHLKLNLNLGGHH